MKRGGPFPPLVCGRRVRVRVRVCCEDAHPARPMRRSNVLVKNVELGRRALPSSSLSHTQLLSGRFPQKS